MCLGKMVDLYVLSWYNLREIRDWRERIMAKKLSTKKPLSGNLRSHAENKTKHKQYPNLQTKKVDGVKVTLSANEWKTMKKAA